MKSHSERTGLVQSIERAFSIIEALKEHQELGIAELSAQLSLDRSTVHRLLATLRVLGYVNQNRENFKYSNSLKFFDIGHSVVRSLGLGRIAMPFMKALAEETQVGSCCDGIVFRGLYREDRKPVYNPCHIASGRLYACLLHGAWQNAFVLHG